MVNKAILVGRIGKEPEARTTQSGKLSVKFTLATDTGFGQNKRTDWHNITTFDKQAEFVRNYLHKGSLVYVEGSIRYSEYEKDGQKRYFTEIWANSVQSLGGRNDQNAGGNFTQEPSNNYNGGYNSAPASASSPAPVDNFSDTDFSDEGFPF